jgi:flagellar basal-body rod modification protein FlgD
MSASSVSIEEALKSSSTSTKTTSKSSLGSLSTDDFLSLMIKELQNQDPTKPTSTTDMLNQMSQLSSITTFEKLNTSFTSLLNLEFIGLSTSMLGKNVSYKNSDGDVVSGAVDSVKYENSNVYLVVGKDEVSLADVTAVDDEAIATDKTTTTEGS